MIDIFIELTNDQANAASVEKIADDIETTARCLESSCFLNRLNGSGLVSVGVKLAYTEKG